MSGRSRQVKVEILGDARGLNKAFDSVSDKAGGLASNLGKTALLGVAAVGAIAAGATVAAFKIGDSFDEAYDTIETGTGATGDALEDLKDSFKNVLTDVPTDFGTASTAIADLNTALGLTGEPLEELAGQFINLGRITGEEVPGLISKGTRAFGDWSIATEDQGEALDFLFKTSQATGVGVQDLMGKVVQFGAPMRQFGFSFEETAALMGRFEKEGVNTELVMGSLRIAGGKFAKENIPLREGLEDVIARIQEMGPSAESTALAMEIFGARAGVDMVDTILNGKFAIEDLMGTLEDSNTTINDTADSTADFGEKWTLFKNKALVAIEPVGTAVFGLAGTLLDKAIPAMDNLGAIVEERVLPVLRGMADWFMTVGLPAIQEFATQAQAFFTDVLLPAVTEFVDFLIPKLMALSEWFMNVGLPAIQNFAETVTGFFNNQIKPAIEGVIDTVLPKLQQLADFLQGHGHETMIAFAGAIIGVVIPALILWAASAATAAAATIAALLPVLVPIALLAAAGAGLALAWETNFFGIRDKTKEVVDQLTVFFNDELMPTITALKDFVVTVFTAIKDFVQRNQEEIRKILEAVWSQIHLVVESALKIIRDVVQLIMALIRGDWDQAWDEIKQIVETTKDLIVGTVTNLKDLLINLFGIIEREVPPILERLADAALDAFVRIVTEAPPKIIELNIKVQQLLGELAVWLLTEGGPRLVKFLIDGLKDLISVDNAKGAVGQFHAFHTAVSKKIGEIAAEALGWGGGIAWDFIQGLIDNMTSFEALNSVFDAAKGLGQSMLDGAKDVLGIGSPSKEGYAIGGWFYQGMIQGLASGEEEVRRSGGSLGRAASEGAEDALIIPGPHESEDGYEKGQKFGKGVALGIHSTEDEAYAAGQTVGGAAAKGASDGYTQSAGSLPMPPGMGGNLESGSPPKGDNKSSDEPWTWENSFWNQGPADGGSGAPPIETDTDTGGTPASSGGSGGTVGFGTGESGALGGQIFGTNVAMVYFWNGTFHATTVGKPIETYLFFLYHALERGVGFVKVNQGFSGIGKGIYKTVALFDMVSGGEGTDALPPFVLEDDVGQGSSSPVSTSGGFAGFGGTTIQQNFTLRRADPDEIAHEAGMAMRLAALDPSLVGNLPS